MSKTAKILSGISLFLIVYAILGLFGVRIGSGSLPERISVFHAIWIQSECLIPLLTYAICAFTLAAIFGVKRGGANPFYMGILILLPVLFVFGFLFYTNLASVPSYETLSEHRIYSQNIFEEFKMPFWRTVFAASDLLILVFLILIPTKILMKRFLIGLKYLSIVIVATSIVCTLMHTSLINLCLGVISESNKLQACILNAVLFLPSYVFLGALCIMAFTKKMPENSVVGMCSFDGRLRRGRFFPLYFFIAIVAAIVGPAYQLGLDIAPMNWVVIIFAILLTIPLRARRLHDGNMSGWWIVLFDNWLVISLIGAICYFCGTGEDVMPVLIVAAWVLSPICKVVEFVLLCLKGTDGDNKYGPDPLRIPKSDVSKLEEKNA